ncbi:hypothetical protein GVAV_001692 [Gurleya vavrai]
MQLEITGYKNTKEDFLKNLFKSSILTKKIDVNALNLLKRISTVEFRSNKINIQEFSKKINIGIKNKNKIFASALIPNFLGRGESFKAEIQNNKDFTLKIEKIMTDFMAVCKLEKFCRSRNLDEKYKSSGLEIGIEKEKLKINLGFENKIKEKEIGKKDFEIEKNEIFEIDKINDENRIFKRNENNENEKGSRIDAFKGSRIDAFTNSRIDAFSNSRIDAFKNGFYKCIQNFIKHDFKIKKDSHKTEKITDQKIEKKVNQKKENQKKENQKIEKKILLSNDKNKSRQNIQENHIKNIINKNIDNNLFAKGAFCIKTGLFKNHEKIHAFANFCLFVEKTNHLIANFMYLKNDLIGQVNFGKCHITDKIFLGSQINGFKENQIKHEKGGISSLEHICNLNIKIKKIDFFVFYACGFVSMQKNFLETIKEFFICSVIQPKLQNLGISTGFGIKIPILDDKKLKFVFNYPLANYKEFEKFSIGIDF